LLIAFAPAVVMAAQDEKDDTPVVPETVVEADSGETLAIGSWLNTPPDRQAVAFDAQFNRLYFNAEGQVVGRYNRRHKKFEAGEFRPAQWHNIAANGDTKVTTPATIHYGTGSTNSRGGYPSASYPLDPRDPIVPPQPKPAEIFRRGQSSAGGGFNRGSVKVIESPTP
jgi:hypothetical protein